MCKWECVSACRGYIYAFRAAGESGGGPALNQITCQAACNYTLTSRNEVLQQKHLPGPGIYMLPTIPMNEFGEYELASDVPVVVRTTALTAGPKNSPPLLVERVTSGIGPTLGNIFVPPSENLMAVRVRGNGVRRASLMGPAPESGECAAQILARQPADESGSVFIDCGGMRVSSFPSFAVVVEGKDGPFKGVVEVTVSVLNYVERVRGQEGAALKYV